MTSEKIHELLTTQQAKCILGVSSKKMYDLVRRGLLSVERNRNGFSYNPHEIYSLLGASAKQIA